MSTFGTEAVLIPDLPEPITGYRAWTVDGWMGTLVGFGSVDWPAGQSLTAQHVDRFHDYRPCDMCPSPTNVEHVGHGCGIYAYRTLEHVARHSGRGETVAWGRVQMWGTVYEHEAGYRSEHAEIVALYVNPEADLTEIAERYGVPLEPLPEGVAEIAPASPVYSFSFVVDTAAWRAACKAAAEAARALMEAQAELADAQQWMHDIYAADAPEFDSPPAESRVALAQRRQRAQIQQDRRQMFRKKEANRGRNR